MAVAASVEFPLPSPWFLVGRLFTLLPAAEVAVPSVHTGPAILDDGDGVLVALALQGDRRAFEKLIRRHYDMIHRVAWRQTGHMHEAEDIVQTVLMQLVERLGSYRGEARFTTWLIGITINACHDNRRRRSSFGRMREALANFASLSGPAADGRDLVRRTWLRSLLAGLSPELRATVVLVAGEGLSHREAAAELGISENTVSWRMHQVRKHFAAMGAKNGAAPQGDPR